MQNLIQEVKEDMIVFDANGERVGTVDEIHFGDEDLENDEVDTTTARKPAVPRSTLVGAIVNAFKMPGKEPEEFEQRLERYGFLKVDPGILSTDRYVMADQIEDVDAVKQRLKLSVTKDEMINI